MWYWICSHPYTPRSPCNEYRFQSGNCQETRLFLFTSHNERYHLKTNSFLDFHLNRRFTFVFNLSHIDLYCSTSFKMTTKEYDALYQQDLDSVSSSSESRNQIYCSRCTADLEARVGKYEKRKTWVERPTSFQVIICMLLLTANFGMIALWWETKPVMGSCVRPLLTYCAYTIIYEKKEQMLITCHSTC